MTLELKVQLPTKLGVLEPSVVQPLALELSTKLRVVQPLALQLSNLSILLNIINIESDIVKIKESIDIFFQEYNIYDSYCYYCKDKSCNCYEKKNLLEIILYSKLSNIKIILNYCFEKKYIINDDIFQKYIYVVLYKRWHAGLASYIDKQLYEWVLLNILTEETIKNEIFVEVVYTNDISYALGITITKSEYPKISYAHLIFSDCLISGKKFIKRIFKYLDSINFDYDNPKTKSLIACALSAQNLYGIDQLLLRNVSANTKDIHDIVEWQLVTGICNLRYTLDKFKKNPETLFNDRYSLEKENTDTNSVSNLHEIKLPISYLGLKEYNKIEYKLSLLLYYDDDLIKLIFLNNQKLSNKELDRKLLHLYIKIVKNEYPNSIYDMGDIKENITYYRENKTQSKEYYEDIYNLLQKICSNGFIPSDKEINLYLNGSNLINICYPDIHQKILKLFEVTL
jgi:hypothetical protein